MCFAPQRRALFPHLNFQKWSVHGVFCTFWLGNVLRATTACTFSTSQLPKVVREWCVLYILTSKCASRHNAVHFFNISTSKSGPDPSVFNTFYFQMCFAPQRRALFQHLNFQKWSDPEVFCTFSLRNRLRATTACNFSSLISPDVSAPAALASLLFNAPEPQTHEKTQCFATFLLFRAPASSFFWSFLFWLFSLLTAFSSLHIVGSLTSKLPSMILSLKKTLVDDEYVKPPTIINQGSNAATVFNPCWFRGCRGNMSCLSQFDVFNALSWHVGKARPRREIQWWGLVFFTRFIIATSTGNHGFYDHLLDSLCRNYLKLQGQLKMTYSYAGFWLGIYRF